MKAPSAEEGRCRQFLVFVPEGNRTSSAVPVDLHDRWVVRMLRFFADAFGGATAYGRGVGVWCEKTRLPRAMHWDRVTVIESWIASTFSNLEVETALHRLMRILGRMRAALNQEAVACILDGTWMTVSRRRLP